MSIPASQQQEQVQYRGLLPGIDRKKIKEPYCVDGRDFLVDIDGPFSGFSRDWLFTDIAEPRGWHTLPTADEDDRYHFVNDAICQYDTETRQLYPVFAHTARQEYWPWSRAICGGVLYLANKEVGLISYTPATGTWQRVEGDNIPAVVYSICVSEGRLVLLGASRVYWSEIDNGTDDGFTPSVDTGAGSQGLSVLSSNTQPLRLAEYEDGFLVFTRDGILRFERTQSAIIFRWRKLSIQHKLLNPWCMAEIVEGQAAQIVFLTQTGLFTTQGQVPVPWQPIMSEFLKLRVIPNIPHAYSDMTVRLTYSKDDGWLCISLSTNGQNSVYNKAYVLSSGEWGSYDRVHVGLGDVFINSGAYEGMWFGVCDYLGTVYRFSHMDHTRVYPALTDGQFDYRLHFDLPPEYAGLDGVSIFRTMMQFDTDKIELLSEDAAAGVYNLLTVINEQLAPNTMPVLAEPIVLDLEAVDYGFIVDTPAETFEDYSFIILTADEFIDYQTLTESYILSTSMGIQSGLLQQVAGLTPYTQEALGASITVGPFAIQQDSEIDYISQLQTAIVSMNDSGSADEIEDYMGSAYRDFDIQEDWLVVAGDEDWGAPAGTFNEYTMQFYGTLDGYKKWISEGITQELDPVIIKQDGKSRFYGGCVSGMYLFGEVTTDTLGETFHLKTMRLNMTDAGRLI